jgi:hypothetical protein
MVRLDWPVPGDDLLDRIFRAGGGPPAQGRMGRVDVTDNPQAS